MPSYRELLRNRAYRPFLASGALSYAAAPAVGIVLVWSVSTAYPGSIALRTSYAALALAFVGLAAAVPTLASAVLSGAFADRFDRARLLRLTNLFAIASTALLAVVFWSLPGASVALPGPPGFYLPLWLLLAIPLWAAMIASTTFFRPAFNALLPSVVDVPSLGSANGLVYAVAVIGSVASSLSAAAVLEVGNAGLAILVPLGLFAATALSLSAIPSAPAVADRGEGDGRSFGRALSEGYRYLGAHPALLQITIASLMVNFFSAVAFVELGLYARIWLDASAAIDLAALTTGLYLGNGVGTLLAGRLRFEARSGLYLIVLAVLQGAAIVILAFSQSLAFSVAAMFCAGLTPGMATTVFLATIQATVPARVMGRVLSADEVGSFAMVPFGQYAGGLLTVAAGIQATFLLVGASIMAVGGGMAAFGPLRRFGFDPKGPGPDRAGGAPKLPISPGGDGPGTASAPAMSSAGSSPALRS